MVAAGDNLLAECQQKTTEGDSQEDYLEEQWHSKPLHGAFHMKIKEIADMKLTYQWLEKSDIRDNTEALIMAAQE